MNESRTFDLTTSVGLQHMFRAVLHSMKGHCPYALLSDILRIAQSQHGFSGTSGGAMHELTAMSDVSVEREDPVESSKIYIVSFGADYAT